MVGSARYSRAQLGTERRREFFESGESDVEHVFRIIGDHIDPHFRPRRALDFGCGVGRLLPALARRCNDVVGVDIADSMLAEAARNCESVAGVKLVKGDDLLSRVEGSFDLIHSYLVFQHIPAARGTAIVARLAQRLEPGGIAALEFLFARHVPLWRKLSHLSREKVPIANAVLNLVQGKRWSAPHVGSYVYSANRLFELMNAHGCESAFVSFAMDGVVLSARMFFRRDR